MAKYTAEIMDNKKKEKKERKKKQKPYFSSKEA